MSIKLLFAGFIFSTLSFINAGQSETLFDPVKTYLKRYRQTINKEDMFVNNEVIVLELHGRRTNQSTLFLLGFFSVGRALHNASFSFKKVQIIISYEMKDSKKVIALASIESVLGLAQGRISPEKFFTNISY